MSKLKQKVSVSQQKVLLNHLIETGFINQEDAEQMRISLVEENLFAGAKGRGKGKKLNFEGTDYTVYASAIKKALSGKKNANRTVTKELETFLELQKELYDSMFPLLVEAKEEGIVKAIAENRSSAKQALLAKIKNSAYQNFITKIEEMKEN